MIKLSRGRPADKESWGEIAIRQGLSGTGSALYNPSMTDGTQLSIEGIRGAFEEAVARGAVVISSPTGSGKSTAVPRWWSRTGRVLVIEPRRVACRGLASWVAKLEETPLGKGVGYAVRDDRRYSDDSRIVFATPGVVLRWMSDGQPLRFDGVIIDEFHERSLDVDLLLALLMTRLSGRLTVMSATMAAGRVAEHLDATLLTAKARRYPVEEVYVAGNALLPDTRGLSSRVDKALERIRDTGDVLLFLPGKAEIAAMAGHLEKQRRFEVLQIHGGLTLEEQSRVFEPGEKQRVILATNVAETSITIPNIGTVLDSGLVRRTRYVDGRGYLTLVPVALDSADQRAGRAGRLREGTCFRLWSQEAVLSPTTPPEIHREALSPLLLAAAACGERVDDLPFLDPPKPYAVDAARDDLSALGAVDGASRITERGRRLFGLPLDAALGSLLVEAEKESCIEAAIDLVAALSVGRAMFTGDRRMLDEQDDLRIDGCDALAHIRAVREGHARRHRLSPFVLKESRAIRRRLRAAWSLPDAPPPPVDRNALVRAALRADRKCGYIARRRRGRVHWANGGTEITLSRESAVDEDKENAVAVLASMAFGTSLVDARIIATAAMPVTFRQLRDAGYGEERVDNAAREGGTVQARITRVFAGAVIESREEMPVGALARQAIASLFIDGKLYPNALAKTRSILDAAALARRLTASSAFAPDMDLGPWASEEVVLSPDAWVANHLETLGVVSGNDLSLLSEGDFIAPDLPTETRDFIDREFPRQLSLGDVKYVIEYDLAKREATLVMTEGKRKLPPPVTTLPTLRGFRVRAKHHSKVWVLRER